MAQSNISETLEINAKFYATIGTDSKGRPMASLFQNTPKAKYSKTKQVFGFYFASDAKRDAWVIKQINNIFEGERRAIERKTVRREAAKTVAQNGSVVTGTLFSHSWGYDQTNIDFYEVISVSGSMATVCQIYQDSERTGHDCGITTPTPGKFFGEPMRRKIKAGYDGVASLNINDCGWCGLWDGKPKCFSDGR